MESIECVKCKNKMTAGFSNANSSLSWIDSNKFNSWAFMDKDLSGARWKKIIPWKGEYFKAFNCTACKIVLIDYSQKYDRKAIESTCLI